MLSKVDLFNARNASEKLEKGLVIEVAEVGSYNDKDKDGKPVEVIVFKAADGKIYTTISGVIASAYDDMVELLEETKEPIKVSVNVGMSLSGREYLYISII